MNGKQLKNSILQWAIQGKFVPQDPNDEPASVLLERIRAEKARLVNEGKIKKYKNESIIFRGDDNSYYEKFLATGEVKCIDDEIPFEIPKGWCWVRLRHILNIGSARRVHEKDWRSSGIPFYRAREIGKLAEYGHVDNDLFIEQELYDEFSQSGVPLSGDLMVTAVGTLGKVYVVHDNEVFYYKDGSVLCLGNTFNLNSNFLKLAIESPFFIAQYQNESQGTTVATLTMVRMNEYLLPIPPIAEQQRIVSMIEDIMPSTNRYEKSQEALDKLNAEIFEKLKKSVLQEAIQGKLVPQDPADEPASVLLGRIREEKQRLLKEGKLKKKDITDSVIFKGDDNKYFEKVENDVLYLEDEIPFEIPETWAWVRLNDICEYIQRGKSPKYSEIKKYPVVAQKCNQWSGFSLEKALFIDPNTLPSYGQERFLQHGDLLWNSTGLGTLGRMAIYNESVNPYGVAVADSHVTVIRPIKSFINFEYLYLYFSSNEVQSVIEDKADGSTKQKELATKTIKSYLVPLPPLTEQYRIVAKYHSVASTDKPKEN